MLCAGHHALEWKFPWSWRSLSRFCFTLFHIWNLVLFVIRLLQDGGTCMEVQIYHSATQPGLGRMSLGINSPWQKYIFSEMYVCTVSSVLSVLLHVLKGACALYWVPFETYISMLFMVSSCVSHSAIRVLWKRKSALFCDWHEAGNVYEGRKIRKRSELSFAICSLLLCVW